MAEDERTAQRTTSRRGVQTRSAEPWFARPDPKPALRTERIVETAHEIVHDGGPEALTLRDLERQLGVGASAIYRRTGNKDQLMIAVADWVLALAPLPERASTWRDELRELSMGLRGVLVEHPHVHPILDSHVLVTPATARLAACAIEILGRAGFAGDALGHAYNAWVGYVLGFSVVESLPTQPSPERDPLRRWVDGFVDDLDPGAFPSLVGDRGRLLNRTFGLRWDARAFGGDGESFEWGLDVLIDGLDRRRPRRTKRA